MTYVLEGIKRRVFDKENEFFVIDSNNLNNVKTKLYGYCIIGDNIVHNANDVKVELLSGTGLYVYVENNGKNIKIMQDYNGSYGLYLFKEDGYFAISNSFQYLVDYLKKDYKLTFNRDYANALMVTDLCSLATKETLINEINQLNQREIIDIDVAEKSYKSTLFDYEEGTVEPDSEEGVAILDNWFNRWTSLLSKYAKDKSFCAELSGGFDSRLTFMLLNSSDIDINEIYISSINDNGPHAEDYEIASEIANHYGFNLNNKPDFKFNIDENFLKNVFNDYYYIKLGFQKYIGIFRPDCNYSLRGSGGECIRKYWVDTKQDIINNFDWWINYYYKKSSKKIRKMVKNSVEKVINNSYNDIKKLYTTLGKEFREEIFGSYLYNESRCRYHFGKGDLIRTFSGLLVLAPLRDAQLAKLKLSSIKTKDNNTLIALIFNRYSNLLNFKFERGRSIDKKTIDYVTEFNNKYPFKKREHFYSNNNKLLTGTNKYFSSISPAPIYSYVYKLYKTKRIKNIITKLFGIQFYYKLIRVANRNNTGWIMNICASLAVAKIYQDCSDNKVISDNIIDNFIDEPCFLDKLIGHIKDKLKIV